MNIANKVFVMRDAGVIKRSHTCRTLIDRNVAEHSHGVAMLALLLYAEVGAVPSGRLLAAALSHDLSEIATGDVPAPIKRKHDALRGMLNAISTDWELEHKLRYSLTSEEAALLLWCDRVDFALYALEEVTMGNRFFIEYLQRIVGWISDIPYPTINGSNWAVGRLWNGIHKRIYASGVPLPQTLLEKGELAK